ncbi:hypothetical protein NMY22_g617 [Coprinellus aureogranulatus]|nr:hypothetical protein NMY22_g617 [Coprinellus aureogranulatus]
MAGSPTTTALERADAALESGKTVEAEKLYQEVLSSSSASNANTTDASIQQQQLRDQEKALVKLGEMYRDQKNAAALSRTLSLSRSFMSSTSTAKAKTAKLIRTLLDFFGAIEGSEEVLKATLQENIEWARKEKRVFLKHSLETRLVGLYLDTQQYRPALALIDTLLTELKRLDDKMILTEVHLLESRVYRGVGNYAKAKAALTSSRTAANSIYCPPILQAQLDLQYVFSVLSRSLPTALVPLFFFASIPRRKVYAALRMASILISLHLFHALRSQCLVVRSGFGPRPRLRTFPLCSPLRSLSTVCSSIPCLRVLTPSLPHRSGVLHAEDKDYTTAYSYFFEAFENFSAQGDDTAALGALKYMLLCKVMLNLVRIRITPVVPRTTLLPSSPSFLRPHSSHPIYPHVAPSPDDVNNLLTIKLATKYANVRDVESMRAIARAHQDRNLGEFERVLREFRGELSSDPTIRSHLASLYDNLLEQNLLRIIEPYSTVEIEYVAELVGQERQGVEAKLSQMILDKVFHGVLDQGRGCLLVFDEPEVDNAYGAAIETLEEVGKVVQSLYAKSVQIA